MVKDRQDKKRKSRWYVRRGNCHVKIIKTFAQKAEVFMFNRDNETKKMGNCRKQLKFIDLFAGIGGIRIAFERAGAKCVFTSEWDKACQQMYEANFGDKPVGDITKVDAKHVPDHDILTAGFPCQAFSIMGERQGFSDTRGTLFFEVERILAAKKPKAFLLENVKQLMTHDKGRTFKIILQKLDNLGYFIHYKILNGLDFGIPQKRERIIIVGFNENFPFRFPSRANGKALTLEDVLEPDEKVERKHFLSEYMLKKLKEKVPNPPRGLTVWHENKAGNIGIHRFSCALRANGSYNYLMVNGKRRLTPREMLRLQGYPDSFKIVVNDSEAKKQAGNSVVIPKIEAVAIAIIQALNHKPLENTIKSDLFVENMREITYAEK
jgi:DNA (cytosine-5)-methyltransferase 1